MTLTIAAAALAGAAAAQVAFIDTMTTVAIAPYDGHLPRGGEALLPVHVAYSYTVGLAAGPTKIDLHVTDAPHWVVAGLDPATLLVNPLDTSHAPGVNEVKYAQTVLRVFVDDDAPEGETYELGISAIAYENGNLRASLGREGVLLRTNDEPTPEPEKRCTNETAEAEPSVVETQTATATPLAPPLAGGLAAAAVAGGAYLLGRKRQ